MTTVSLVGCAPGDALAASLVRHRGHRVLHLLRHGESVHQVVAVEAATRGVRCRCDEPGVDEAAVLACPYRDPALIDDALTARGLAEVQGTARGLEVDLVLTACARRSLATVTAAFDGVMPRCLALEGLRARTGMHMHSRRRARSVLAAEFPSIDFSAIAAEEDPLWSPRTETRASIDRRVQAFLRELLARPERSVAIVTHFTVLLALMNGAADHALLGENPERPRDDAPWLDVGGAADPASLRRWLGPGELRTLVVAPR